MALASGVDYNTVRPHSSLGYKPPAPETERQLLTAPHVTTEQENVVKLNLVLTMIAIEFARSH